MRILHVTNAYAPFVGGAERKVRFVSERLVARGHKVSVFAVNGATLPEVTSSSGGTLPARETINGVTVHRFPPEGWLTRLYHVWRNLPGGWRSSNYLLGKGVGMLHRLPSPLPMLPALLRAKADIVTAINWSYPQAYICYLARRTKKFALVGVPILHTAQAWTQNEMFPPMLARCDAVLTNTRAEEEFVVARGARNVVVGGTGITPEDFAHPDGGALRRKFGLGDAPVVGQIGRQERLKGTVTLLEAMRDVWRTVPTARLLLAGPSAHRSREFSERLAALTGEERSRVTLVDDFTDDEIANVADACDLIAMPSVEEGFGAVYLEGWMCGKPVIGARIPSTQEVIAEGVDGLLVKPFEPEELTRGILELLGDESRRRRMGAAGRAKTLANHTWDAVTDRWERVFLGLVPGAV